MEHENQNLDSKLINLIKYKEKHQKFVNFSLKIVFFVFFSKTIDFRAFKYVKYV